MSQDRIEIVRQGIEAWNQHDFEMGIRHLAPDVEWRPASPAAVERSVYRGLEEVARAFDAIWETWDTFHLEEHEIRDLGDSVLWLGTVHMRGGASQVELDQEFGIHCSLRGGRVVRARAYPSWAEALQVAGPEGK
jgi:ketosteroid isomerase-like protein